MCDENKPSSPERLIDARIIIFLRRLYRFHVFSFAVTSQALDYPLAAAQLSSSPAAAAASDACAISASPEVLPVTDREPEKKRTAITHAGEQLRDLLDRLVTIGARRLLTTHQVGRRRRREEA